MGKTATADLITEPGSRAVVGVVMLCAALAAGCTLGSSAPIEVSLVELTSEEEAFLGERVQVTGTVRMFEAQASFARHYVLEDDHENRVRLDPGDLAAKYVGQQVITIGRFEFDEGVGRFLRVERIDASGEDH